MKRGIGVFVGVLVCAQLLGCATVQKKFTRKKKEPAHTAAVIYTEEGPYQKKYSNGYYYKIHFTQWKSWHSDLIDDLGGNGKKLERDADEAVNHLEAMSKYLDSLKQQELKPQLDALKAIVQKLESGHYTNPADNGMRAELETIRRIIANNFYYSRIQNDLVPDTVDLGTTPAPTPPTTQ